jgi:cob(I)alamin adenosyltransferase
MPAHKHSSTAVPRQNQPGRGDDGTTDLLVGRVEKTNDLIAVLGALDEVNAMLGLALSFDLDEAARREIIAVQQHIYQLSAHVAARGAYDTHPPLPDMLAMLDHNIAVAQDQFVEDAGFIQYDGRSGPAALQVARAMCRRAELALWQASHQTPFEPAALHVLNRMSLWLFYMARMANIKLGQHEHKVTDLAP